jgi:rod shape determining protein RodA
VNILNINNYHIENRSYKKGMDWWIFGSILPIVIAGLVTMSTFKESNAFAEHQIIWICVGYLIFFLISHIDLRFLRSTFISVSLFAVSVASLLSLTIIGKISHGAESWISFGFFALQPSDLAKLALIIVLAKYFSRRHIEIANIRHVLVSGVYALIPFALVLMHPDMGSAMILFFIWLGMILVSGISKKHLLVMILVGAVSFMLLWSFGFKEYQKDRIRNFINPMSDIHGAGYNAYQSAIAIGSGQIFGKGLGYGTQSRLKFLPEYQTDFIFAAFAEEWGFAGVVILFALYMLLIYRIIRNAMNGATNFEILFGAGVAVYFIVHITVNVGMNMHLLPVTGTPLPFMSYGGTHTVTEFILLGMMVAMRRYSMGAHKDTSKQELVIE